MVRTPVNLDPERKFITLLIVNDEACRVLHDFDRALLKTPYAREVAGWCLEYFDKYRKAPVRDIMEIWKTKRPEIGDEETVDMVNTFLTGISEDWKKSEPNNADYSIDRAHECLKQRTKERYAEAVNAAIEAGDDIPVFKPYSGNSDDGCRTYTGNELLTMEFPPIIPLVPEFLMLGSCVLLVGGPKLGKSWLVEQLAVAISKGGLLYGKWQCEKQHVLLLANEDSERLLADRLKKLNAEHLNRLHVKFGWKTRGAEAVATVRRYFEANPETKLVIIDCLATIRGARKGSDVYMEDYREIERWRDLTHDLGITILIVHHTKKLNYETVTLVDVMDMINGSNGLAGAVDRSMVLVRTRGKSEAKLFSMGRDCKDLFLGLHWDDVEIGDGWTVAGDMEKVQMSQERMKIIGILEDHGGVMKPGQIARLAECGQSNATQILQKLVIDGYVEKGPTYGTYKIVS